MKLTIGQYVIYLKTGTEGKIVKFHDLDGKNWAELDTTGLLYEENSLEPADPRKKTPQNMERQKVMGEGESAGTEEGLHEMRDEGRPDSSGTVGGGG